MELRQLMVTPDGGYNCGKYHISHFYGSVEDIQKDLRTIMECQSPDDEYNLMSRLAKKTFQHLDIPPFGCEDYPETGSEEYRYLLTATLNDNQYCRIEPLLLEAGFKEVCKWINPNTLNECKLYINNGE